MTKEGLGYWFDQSKTVPFKETLDAKTIYQQLCKTTEKHGERLALAYQLKSGPKDKNETLTWKELKARITQTANMFRANGIKETDVIAYILPNTTETALTLFAGMTAGIVNPINPMLDPETIGALLRESGAKAVVTLKAFPKTELAEQVAQAVKLAPNVETVFEVDLTRYLAPPLKWIVPFIRPKVSTQHHAKILDFNAERVKHSAEALTFTESDEDRIAAYFHTGGTTGIPKIAQHRFSGILYNGWVGDKLLFSSDDVLFCPLPLFHVLAAYPVAMTCLCSGAALIMVTPQGYRGEGVFDNFWKLVERYKASFIIGVPTAISALMQRKVDADISSLRLCLTGSAPMPVELFNRFEKATNLKILEGYGMTETTCVISINFPNRERKVGSVGLPFPYSEVKIIKFDDKGNVVRECDIDEVGEICSFNPGVIPGDTYTNPAKNVNQYAYDKFFRTGDLGRLDGDGYLWITGRAKDLIIRGGHNVDPAMIEDAALQHPDVAFAGAIGQPDSYAGELPCLYAELVEGGAVTSDELHEFIKPLIPEQAAIPKYVEILGELPKTAVGKIFKPDLRKKAIKRVFDEKLQAENLDIEVVQVVDDKKLGLVAELSSNDVSITDETITHILGGFANPWRWHQ